MMHKLIAIAAAGLAGSVILLAAAEGRAQGDSRSRIAGAFQAGLVLPAKPHTGPLPALPRVSFDPPRSAAVVQQVYEFAARHPEVFQYVPCYCGCERVGTHATIPASSVARPRRRVTEWDSHGMACPGASMSPQKR